MFFCADGKACLSLMYQNRQVKVTLEFPRQADERAEQEFISRLKAVWIERMEEEAAGKERKNIE